MYNESRGTDSCGYYFNGHIEKGINLQSWFSEFIADVQITSGPLKGNVFMGHTRKGTGGARSLENAHPHVVNNNYVQTHNGVIKNIWTMCNNYGVKHGAIGVDSIGLAHLIEKFGPQQILEEYVGHAALAFTYMSDSEALYLFRGASRDEEGGALIPERPLFVLYQPEGVYYSSMKNSLDAINSEPKETSPWILTQNILYEVVNGEFTKYTLKINREDNNIEKWKSAAKHSSNYTTAPKYSLKAPPPLIDISNDNDIILTETPPDLSADKANSVFYYQGKYYRIDVRQYTPGKTEVSSRILDGEVIINRDGLIIDEEDADLTDNRQQKYYFINGWRIKSKESYEHLITQCVSGLTEYSFEEISKHSKYPIIQIRSTAGIGKTLWYCNGVPVRKQTFGPKFTNKKYKLRFGTTNQIISPDTIQHNV